MRNEQGFPAAGVPSLPARLVTLPARAQQQSSAGRAGEEERAEQGQLRRTFISLCF